METPASPAQPIRITRVRLEAASICQLRCPSCPTTKGAVAANIGGGRLKFADFEKFIWANPQLEEIELSNWGEIFLNKDLLQIIKLAFALKVSLVARNGVNFNHVSDEMLEALVKFRFRILTISLDGASQATYSQYRRGGNFDRIIENIEKLNFYKAKYDRAKPELFWQFVVFGHNQHEIETAKEMAQRLDMTIRFKLNWDSHFSPIEDPESVRTATGLGAASRQEFDQNSPVPYLGSICDQLWIEPQIHHDGRMLGCCTNFWGDFGNVFTDGLHHVVNGEKMTYARRMLTGDAPPRIDIPCTSCKRYLSMREKQSFIPPKT